MKEQILQAIGKIEVYFEHTFEGHSTSTAECYCEFDNETFIITFYAKEKANFVTSVDYPEVVDIWIENFEINDPNGNAIDTDITDEEILNALKL